jgi:nucleoid-associated protein YgaU
MTNPTKLIINCETKEQIEVELTDEEIAQLEADRVKAEADKAERDAAEAAKATAKASAEAKLAALGLTVEEISAL